VLLETLPGLRNLPVTRRKFGVELEHGNRDRGHTTVLNELKKKGFPTGDRGRVRAFLPPTCYTSTADGTGVEIRTPALQGLSGLEELERVITLLKELGGYTTSADGMHVHHQARDYYGKWEKIEAISDSWVDNRALIAGFVNKYRWTSGSCPAIDKVRVARAVKEKRYAFMRNDLNLAALPYHGTIEIRLHEGTLDPQKAVAWVVFGQAFIGTVSKHGKFGKQKSREDLLDHLGIADKYAEVLLGGK
jgi:Putative amidoligase enzyme